MPIKQLKEFLDANNIKYITINHSRAFTARETAQSAHIQGKDMAKTVMIKINNKMVMAVLPSSFKIDFDLLKQAVGPGDVVLADEREFKNLFPACEVGAMPPFGNLYNMEVFVEKHLTKDKEIAFNAGTHRELISMAYKDFERLVKPKVMKFSALLVDQE